MNKLVIYVRHAESYANKIIHDNKKQHEPLNQSQKNLINSLVDPDITEIGIKQAKCTASHLINNIKKLNRNKITVLVSPFKRTQHTCTYFIELLDGSEICYDAKIIEELREYSPPKMSSSTALTVPEVPRDILVQESVNRFMDQVLEFNEMLKKEFESCDTIIIFGHSLFFSTLISYHVTHELYRPTDIPTFQLPNCSISCEGYNIFNELNNKKTWKTYMVSSISHLGKDIVTGNHVPF